MVSEGIMNPVLFKHVSYIINVIYHLPPPSLASRLSCVSPQLGLHCEHVQGSFQLW